MEATFQTMTAMLVKRNAKVKCTSANIKAALTIWPQPNDHDEHGLNVSDPWKYTLK